MFARMAACAAVAVLAAPAVSAQETDWVSYAIAEAKAALIKVPKPEPLARFAALCEEEEGTGFAWKNAAWNPARFELDKYVIRKLDMTKPGTPGEKNAGCVIAKPLEPTDFGTVQVLTGCYSWGRFGENPISLPCEETHGYSGSFWQLLSVTCRDVLDVTIKFKPQGPFAYTQTEANLDTRPEGDYKRAMKISHGSCAVIG